MDEVNEGTKLMSHGVVIGKFWPLHYGHDLMIMSALKTMDEVTIIVSNSHIDRNLEVVDQLTRRYGGFLSLKEIRSVIDWMPQVELDVNGISKDKNYLIAWALIVKEYNPTHIISSDLYGKTLSDMLNIEWLPIDPDRIVIPKSGTSIRSNLRENWQYITSEAKEDWSFKVAIVGAESTGKSTLVKSFGVDPSLFSIVPEWGRTISEVKNNSLNYKDFRNIIDIQNNMILSATNFSPIVVTDTEAIITHLYGEKYLKNKDLLMLKDDYSDDIDWVPIDYYIVMAPTVPWVDDGTRIMSNQEDRENFNDDLVEMIKASGKPYSIITETNWKERSEQVSQIIFEQYKFNLVKRGIVWV